MQKLTNYNVMRLLGGIALFFVFASLSYAQPSQSPPDGNTAPPLNVSSVTQVKTGSLGIGGSLSVSRAVQLGSTTAICNDLTEGSVMYLDGVLQICSNTDAVTQGTSSEYWTGVGDDIYFNAGNAAIGTDTNLASLRLRINGRVGADEFCDAQGNNCIIQSDLGNSYWTQELGNLWYTLGDIGIGTENPARPLSVHDNVAGTAYPVRIRNDNTGANTVGIELFNAAQRSVIASERTGTNAGTDLVFSVNNSAGSLTEGFRLTEAGRLGVGDSTPNGLLRVDVAGKLGANEYCDSDGNNCVLAENLQDSLWTATGTDVYYTGGDVGIGVTNPQENLHTNLNIRVGGGRIYFGDTQHLYGANTGALTHRSGDAVFSRFDLRTDSNDYLGSLIAQAPAAAGGEGIGILDGDNTWVLRSLLNNSTELRVDNETGLILTNANGSLTAAIGTTTPSIGLELDVAGNIGANQYCDEDGNNCVDIGSLSQGDNLGNHTATSTLILNDNWISNDGGSEGIRVANNGNVGVGDSSPSQALEVGGNISMSSGRNLYFGNQTLYGDNNQHLYFDSNNSTQARINLRDSGNVQLGAIYGNDNGTFGLLDADSDWAVQSNTDSNINFRVNNDEKVRILSNGNVGIGVTNPGSRLDIAGGALALDNASWYSARNSGGTTQGLIRLDGTNLTTLRSGGSGIDIEANSGSSLVRVEDGGDVGIGDATPDGTLKLDVAGQVGATEYCDESGANCVAITDLGGDNLGDHTATQNIALGAYDIIGDSRLDINTGVLSGVYDGGTSDSPYSRVNADSLHTNGLGAGQLYLEGRAIDGNSSIYLGAGLAGGQSATDVRLGDNNEVLVDTSTNQVGIGTASPSEKLDVSGNIALSAGRHVYFGSQDLYGDNGSYLYFDSNSSDYSSFVLRDAENTNIGYLFGGDNGSFGLLDADGNWFMQTVTDSHINFRINNDEKMRVTSGGNVGIGTTGPSTLLHVYANNTDTTQPNLRLEQDGTGDTSAYFSVAGGATYSLGIDNSDSDAFKLSQGTDLGSGNLFTVTSGGNVGIGTTSPAVELAVDGDVGATNFCDAEGNNCVAQGDIGGGLWSENGSDIYYNSGNVGIGTASPNARLSVGTGGAMSEYPMIVSGYNIVGPLYQQLRLDAGTTNGYLQGAISMVSDNVEVATIGYQGPDDTDTAGILTFSTRQSGTVTETVRIDDSGNVGIGDTSPSQKLSVAGNIESTAGRHLYFGSQDLYGANNQHLYYDSNDTNEARINLRDSGNTQLGALYGNDSGAFGLLDADGNWAIQSDTDSSINFRINDTEEARVLPGGLAVGTTALSGTLALDVEGQTGATEYCDQAGNNCFTAADVSGAVGGGGVVGGSGTTNYVTKWNASGELADSQIFDDASAVGIGDATPDGTLKLDVAGQVGATEYCDEAGANCIAAANLGADNLGNHTATQNVNIGDNEIQNTRALQGIDWDDNTGGTDNKYRLLFRDGAHMFYDGGVVVGSYGNGTWTDLSDGRLIVEDRIGIGDTNPGQKLDVAGNISMSAGRHLYFGSQDLYGDNSSALYFDSNHSTVSQFILRDAENDRYGSLYGAQGDDFGLLDGDSNWALQIQKDSNINFRVNNDEKMRITNAGNVGIGTTDMMDAKLNIESASADGTVLQAWTEGADEQEFALYGDFAGGGPTGNQIRLGSGISGWESNILVLRGDGNVGIGTTDLTGKLEVEVPEVVGSTNIDWNAFVVHGRVQRSDQGGVGIKLAADHRIGSGESGENRWAGIGISPESTYGRENALVFYTGDANTEKLRIDSTGNVGIGDTTPDGTLKLDVEGQIGATEYCDEAGNNCKDISTVGAESNTASIGSAGWYRIASNGPVADGASGGDRASAQFSVYDTQSGRHSAVTFVASVHYGNQPTLSVLNRSAYSSDGIIKKIRLVEGGTYEGAAVEIYVGGTGSVQYYISDNNHTNGWVPEDWSAGSVPAGFAATQIDLDTQDPILAGAADANSNTFVLDRQGNLQLNGSNGKHVYFGSQDLYGDNGQALYFDSNNSNTTRLTMRDAQNTRYGELYGTSNGDRFGLLDGDGSWILDHNKDDWSRWLINNSEQMRLTTTGLGIGTTDPSEKFEVYNGRISIDAPTGSDSAFRFYEGGTVKGHFYHDASANEIRLEYDGTIGLTLADSGNVGIGDTTPDGTLKLDVEGAVGATQYCDENGANCTTAGSLGGDNLGNHTATTNLNMNANGIASADYVDFQNHEITDFNSNGRLFWDASAGMYVQSSNAGHTNPALLWSSANFTAGSNLNVSYGSEDEPTLSVDSNPTFNSVSVNGGGSDLNLNGTQIHSAGSYITYFDANHSTLSEIQLRDAQNTNYGSLYGSGNGSTFGLLDGDHNWAIQIAKDSNITWRINNNAHMRLTTTGLGIGNTSPSQKLDVTGTAQANTFRSTANANNQVVLEYDGGWDLIKQISARGGVQISSSDDTMYIGNGDVAHQYNGTYVNTGAENFYNASDGNIYFYTDLQEGWGTQHEFAMLNNGRMGIGNTSPGEKLHVSGRVLATGFVQSSDESLKTDIATIENPEKLLDLRGVSFEWKGDGRADYGFIAQEVEELYPQLVATDENTGLKSVNYANMSALLLELVKKQEEQLKEQEERLDSLEERVEALESKE